MNTAFIAMFVRVKYVPKFTRFIYISFNFHYVFTYNLYTSNS